MSKAALLKSAAFVVATVAAVGPAWGSGFQLKEQSASGLGRAFAGATAGADGFATIFYNPAGMTLIDGSGGEASVSYIAPSTEFSGDATRPVGLGGGTVAGTTGEDAGENAFLPAAYAMWSATDDLKIGLRFNAPWGLATEYDSNSVVRYHALRSELITMNFGPSIAYRISDFLSVGAGAQIQHAEAKLTNAIFTGGADAVSTLEGDDWGWGFQVGAMLHLAEGTRIGVQYTSEVQHTLEGTVIVRPALVADRDAEADLTTPDVISVGLYQQITPKWAIMGELAWTNWKDFKELRVVEPDGTLISQKDENWEDTWFFSVGTEYRPTEQLALRLGAAYDMTPVKDEFRTARIPDEDRYWVSAGLGYSLSDAIEVNVAYTHIFVKDSSIFEASDQGIVLDGSYENAVDIGSVNVRITF